MSPVPYLPTIRRIARLYHTSFLEPDDLVQEACLALLEWNPPSASLLPPLRRAWEGLSPSPEGRSEEVSLLIHRAIQSAIRRYESPAVVRMLPGDLVRAAEVEPTATEEPEPDIEELIKQARLSPRERQVLSLRYGLGSGRKMNYRAIAAQLGIAERTVDTILHHAIRKMKKNAKK